MSAAGVSVVGAFDGEATGREARIKAAEHRLNRARDTQETAAQTVRDGEEGVAEGQRRLEGAQAGCGSPSWRRSWPGGGRGWAS